MRQVVALCTVALLCGCPGSAGTAPSAASSPTPSASPAGANEQGEVDAAPTGDGAASAVAARSAPEADSALAGRSYVLRVEGDGAELQAPLALRADAGRVAIDLDGRSVELTLDDEGRPVAGAEPATLALLQSALQPRLGPGGVRRVDLPGGGRLDVKTSEPTSLPERSFQQRRCAGRAVEAEVRGRLASGQAVRGTARIEVWLDGASDELVALRATQQLELRDRGPVAVTLSLAPARAGDPIPRARGEKRVGLLLPPAQQRLDAPQAAFGCALLLLVAGSPWLRGRKTLCLLLCLAFLMPLGAVQAQSFWDHFKDPTEGELLGSVLTVVAVGLGAAVAAVTAPVWVPVAVAGAGVVGLGTYWATRTPPIRAGEVYERVHEPADTYLTWIATPVVTSNGKTTTTTIVMTPMWVYDDEDWVIRIRDGERTRKIYVDAETYEQVRVGQRYDMDARGGAAEDDNQRRKATDAERGQLEAAKQRGQERIPLEASGAGAAGAVERSLGD